MNVAQGQVVGFKVASTLTCKGVTGVVTRFNHSRTLYTAHPKGGRADNVIRSLEERLVEDGCLWPRPDKPIESKSGRQITSIIVGAKVSSMMLVLPWEEMMALLQLTCELPVIEPSLREFDDWVYGKLASKTLNLERLHEAQMYVSATGQTFLDQVVDDLGSDARTLAVAKAAGVSVSHGASYYRPKDSFYEVKGTGSVDFPSGKKFNLVAREGFLPDEPKTGEAVATWSSVE